MSALVGPRLSLSVLKKPRHVLITSDAGVGGGAGVVQLYLMMAYVKF